ncbi:MAG: hypothetical protein HY727_08055 [Candidatus Rokubacteria bacterium]|nr:hypothetical protein [Candidatus Rokubacteria bacterium]
MSLGRALLSGSASLLLLAGCASMGNTLAQDLAWERWQKCNHFPTITLKEIETDGRIWVWTQYGSDLSAWQECDRKAREEQARGAAASIPPSTMAVASPQLAYATSVPPVWKRGDEWAYRYDGPTGKGTYVWSVDREEAIDGIPHYVIKAGTREIFYRKPDFAFTRETVDGAIVLNSTPSRFHYVWPMHVGQTWEQTVLEEKPAARQTSERVDAVTVEAEETVTVPAGTFKALKIVVRNRKTGATRVEAWYSPQLKQVVLLRENLESGLRVRELIAYKLR